MTSKSKDMKKMNKHVEVFIKKIIKNANYNDIQILDLSNNKIIEISDDICNLKQLTGLDLSNNNFIKNSKEFIIKLNKLLALYNEIKINIFTYKFDNLKKEFTTICKDFQFYLINQSEKQIMSTIIDKIKYYEHQDILLIKFNNALPLIQQLILNNTNLTNINLSNCNLDILNISTLTNLTSIDFSNNHLTKIPEDIYKLYNLTSINFSNNQLTEIPKDINELSNLTNIDFSNNQLTKISDCVYELTDLTYINFSNNQLTEIPEHIYELTNLTYINFSNNKISKIPECIGTLTNLTSINFSNNQLTEIPEYICALVNLSSVDFSNNQLTEISWYFGSLTKLTDLYLNNNKITEIPEYISTFTNLININLDENKITEIPEYICNLSNLQSITINSTVMSNYKNILDELEKDRDEYTELDINTLNILGFDYEDYYSYIYDDYRRNSDPYDSDGIASEDCIIKSCMEDADNGDGQYAMYISKNNKKIIAALKKYNCIIKKLPDNILNLQNLKKISFCIKIKKKYMNGLFKNFFMGDEIYDALIDGNIDGDIVKCELLKVNDKWVIKIDDELILPFFHLSLVSPIPPKLIKYIGLEKDIFLSELGELLYQRFKNENIINGNIFTLNKDIATALNKEEGRKITLSEFKNFIKEFYDEAFPVTLSRF
jgi:Leucine-rich repeat (LRR) protein